MLRGYVEKFDAETIRWSLAYPVSSSAGVHKESVDFTTLEARVRLRFHHDHGARMHEPTTNRAIQPDESATKLRESLLATCDANWATSDYAVLAYDAKHFIPNWSAMLAAPEKSEEGRLFKTMTSDALFRILPGEHDAVNKHATDMGCKDTKRLRRKYYKKHAMFSCPEPRIIMDGLIDVYLFFKTLPNPSGVGTCLTADAESILRKELKYVARGLLSDLPDMKMYVEVGRYSKGVRPRLRCIRGTNALEGQHLHFRVAEHPCARASGLVLANARGNLFDWAWNLKALVRAGLLPNLGHFMPWLNDLALHALAGLSDDEFKLCCPPSLRRWLMTDVSVEPLTAFGIQWKELLRAAGEHETRAPSMLRTRADIDAVLATTELARAVCRGDAAGVARLSGITTDAGSLTALKVCARAREYTYTRRARAIRRSTRRQRASKRARRRDTVVAPRRCARARRASRERAASRARCNVRARARDATRRAKTRRSARSRRCSRASGCARTASTRSGSACATPRRTRRASRRGWSRCARAAAGTTGPLPTLATVAINRAGAAGASATVEMMAAADDARAMEVDARAAADDGAGAAEDDGAGAAADDGARVAADDGAVADGARAAPAQRAPKGSDAALANAAKRALENSSRHRQRSATKHAKTAARNAATAARNAARARAKAATAEADMSDDEDSSEDDQAPGNEG